MGAVFDITVVKRAIGDEVGSALPTRTCETPRGGRHLYFAVPDREAPGNRTAF